MQRNIKNNKNSALISQYPHKFLQRLQEGSIIIKTGICEITIYFCSFTTVENVAHHFIKC